MLKFKNTLFKKLIILFVCFLNSNVSICATEESIKYDSMTLTQAITLVQKISNQLDMSLPINYEQFRDFKREMLIASHPDKPNAAKFEINIGNLKRAFEILKEHIDHNKISDLNFKELWASKTPPTKKSTISPKPHAPEKTAGQTYDEIIEEHIRKENERIKYYRETIETARNFDSKFIMAIEAYLYYCSIKNKGKHRRQNEIIQDLNEMKLYDKNAEFFEILISLFREKNDFEIFHFFFNNFRTSLDQIYQFERENLISQGIYNSFNIHLLFGPQIYVDLEMPQSEIERLTYMETPTTSILQSLRINIDKVTPEYSSIRCDDFHADKILRKFRTLDGLKILTRRNRPATKNEQAIYFFNNFGFPALGLITTYFLTNISREIKIGIYATLLSSFIYNRTQKNSDYIKKSRLSDNILPSKKTILPTLIGVGAYAITRFFG